MDLKTEVRTGQGLLASIELPENFIGHLHPGIDRRIEMNAEKIARKRVERRDILFHEECRSL